MIFAADAAVAAAGGWSLIRRLGLTERVTLVPDMEARRELTLRGDAILLPESLGEHRTLTLDAMAAGMVVIAAADPMVPVLSDARTARLVQRPAAAAWREALEWMLRDAPGARALGAAAREHVKAHCRASTHVASVLGAYEWMTAGAAIPFTGPA
jgi:glycosyltransferase involved in cell wall biosynthesis